jgi:hypothetical protein
MFYIRKKLMIRLRKMSHLIRPFLIDTSLISALLVIRHHSQCADEYAQNSLRAPR